MPKLNIDGREVEVPAGATVLDAARKLGVSIPTLCYLDGYEYFTACMVCMVRETRRGKLLPACSARASEGMVIETDGEEVRAARKEALQLLLSEHLGDCEGPCRLFCPAYMDIPLMIRQIAAGDLRAASDTVRRHIPFPSVLGRICPAPCEKGCRRAEQDAAVSICLLKGFVGDAYLADQPLRLPAADPPSGKTVAIVGAGPAGMTAAYYLLQRGHGCVLFDDKAEPGGMVREAVPAERLPRGVLDGEIDVLRRMGARFQPKTAVGKDVSVEEIRKTFAAVILAAGALPADRAANFGVPMSPRGVRVDPRTLQTGETGVFAGGGLVQPGRMAVRSVAHGGVLACSVDQYLRGKEIVGRPAPFNFRFGKIRDGEITEFMKEADPSARAEPGRGAVAGFDEYEARKEAPRCLHCDCRKAVSCRLRRYSAECGADPDRYGHEDRVPFQRLIQHPRVVYEPGKCIKCGLCVRITDKAREKLGLTFVGRGFDLRIGVPFDESLAEALDKTADACVNACPTAALAFRDSEERK